MARIYNKAQYGDQFQPRQQSRGFNPVTVVNNSNKEKQKLKQKLNDVQTEAYSLNSSQKIQQGALKLNQVTEQAQLTADQAQEKANFSSQKAITDGILKLSQTALQGAELYNKHQAAKKVENEANDFLFGGGNEGLVDNYSPSTLDDNVDFAQQADKASFNQETAIQETIPVDQPQLQEDLRAPTANASAARNVTKVSTTQAAAMIGSDLSSFLESDALVQLPDGRTIRAFDARTGPEIAAVAATGVRTLTSQYGISRGDPGAIQGAYLGQAKAAFQNAVSARSTKMRSALQLDRADAAFQASSVDMFSGKSPQEVYTKLYEDLAVSGVSVSKKELNDKTRKHLIDTAKNMGTDGIDFLKNLKGVQKRPGVKGTELNLTDGEEIDKAIRDIRNGSVANYNSVQNEKKVQIDQTKQDYNLALLNAKNPDEIIAINQKFESDLLAIGGTEAMKQYQDMRGKDDRHNPYAIGKYMEDIASGNPPDMRTLEEAYESGALNAEEFKSAKAAINGGANQKKLEPFKKEIGDTVKSRVDLKIKNTKGADLSTKELALVSADLTDRVNAYMLDWVEANPDATSGQIRLEAQNVVDAMVVKNLEGVGADKFGRVTGYTFKDTAKQSLTRTYPNPITGKQARVLYGVSTTDLKALNADKNQDNDLNIYNDGIITDEELAAGVETIRANGSNYSARVKAIAQAAGVTPSSLIYAQGVSKGYDVDSMVKEIRQNPPASLQQSGTGPIDIKSGVNYLEGMGFSRKGAEYLSANIQQESSWNGQRDWGQVKGDGTSRNGGLVSWASWSNNPARLGKIEGYLGKSIKQASHAEQLAAMRWEMEKSYPDAYRTFNNPNSTDAQLRGASEDYWGYGEEGKRFTTYLNQARNAGPMMKGRSLAYRTGNEGPTSTGQHLDVKMVGGGRFDLSELEQFVEVDDKDHGTVSLAALRGLTNNVGDNFDQHRARGSHGWDVGTYTGTQVYLKNGARVVSSVPSEHGEYTVIQLPNGKQFSFLHGFKA